MKHSFRRHRKEAFILLVTLLTLAVAAEAGRRTRPRFHRYRSVDEKPVEYLEDLMTTESRQDGSMHMEKFDLIAMEDGSHGDSVVHSVRVKAPPSVKKEDRTGRALVKRRPIRMRRPLPGRRRGPFKMPMSPRRRGHNDNVMTETNFAPHKVVTVVKAPQLGPVKPTEKSNAFVDLIKKEKDNGNMKQPQEPQQTTEKLPIVKIHGKPIPFKPKKVQKKHIIPRKIPRRSFNLNSGMNLLNQVAQSITKRVRPSFVRGRPNNKPKFPSKQQHPQLSSGYGVPSAPVVSTQSGINYVEPPRDEPMAEPISIPHEPKQPVVFPETSSSSAYETSAASSIGFVPTGPRNNFADAIKEEIDSGEELDFNIDVINPTPYPIDKKDVFRSEEASMPQRRPHLPPDIPKVDPQIYEEPARDNFVLNLPFEAAEKGE